MYIDSNKFGQSALYIRDGCIFVSKGNNCNVSEETWFCHWKYIVPSCQARCTSHHYFINTAGGGKAITGSIYY